jgi:hypothetical protein
MKINNQITTDAISNKKASNTESIASSRSKCDILIAQLKLTRKQYYLRLSRLLNAGLVKEKKADISL